MTSGPGDPRGGAETVVLALALFAAAVIGLGGAWWMAQPDGSLTQFERLGGEIGCVCGTCPNRPIATCGCGFADGMLDELQVAISQGQSDTQIVAAFASRYGDTIRIKPASSGLDFTAWAAPILLLTVGAVAVGAVVLRWSRIETPPVDPEADSPASVAPIEPDEAARLRAEVERELEELDN